MNRLGQCTRWLERVIIFHSLIQSLHWVGRTETGCGLLNARELQVDRRELTELFVDCVMAYEPVGAVSQVSGNKIVYTI